MFTTITLKHLTRPARGMSKPPLRFGFATPAGNVKCKNKGSNMGAIKDVVDLATRLSESIEDRRFTADLMEVIQLIHVIQSEQAGLTENNIELMSNNAELKRTISSLESQITELQQQVEALQSPTKNNEAELAPKTAEILYAMCTIQQSVSSEQIASQFDMPLDEVSYHFNLLREKEFIRQATVGATMPRSIAARGGRNISTPATFAITPEGTKYVEVIRT